MKPRSLTLRFIITGNCDNCVRPGGLQYRNMSEEAHLLMTAIKACGGKFGLGIPIDVLRGSMVCYLLFRNTVRKLAFRFFEELIRSVLSWGLLYLSFSSSHCGLVNL